MSEQEIEVVNTAQPQVVAVLTVAKVGNGYAIVAPGMDRRQVERFLSNMMASYINRPDEPEPKIVMPGAVVGG